MVSQEKLLTPKEAAKRLGLSEEKVKELATAGILSSYTIGGIFVRFSHEQLAAWQATQSAKKKPREKAQPAQNKKFTKKLSRQDRTDIPASFSEMVADFLYYNDFYIITAFLITGMLFAILYYRF